ncbi:MAG: hypothetical protein EOP05_06510 [Proteobacteria bacterium]|nr:MAG: hypothetical protein EOP05_06510 [Pseudomonadota bacterium]
MRNHLALARKALLVAAVFTSSESFAAKVDQAAIPANLICAAPAAKVRSVRGFKITKLNDSSAEAQPESSFRMGFQEMSEDEGMVTVSFSDECEGWYAVYFKEKDLKALKTGTITRVTGELEYDDLGEFFPGHPDDGTTGHDKVDIVCKVAKTGVLANRYD